MKPLLFFLAMMTASQLVMGLPEGVEVERPEGAEVEVDEIEDVERDFRGNDRIRSYSIDFDTEEHSRISLIVDHEPERTDTLVKGENLESTSFNRLNESFRISAHRPGEYHIVRLTPEGDYDNYMDPTLECTRMLDPGPMHFQVESCDLADNVNPVYVLVPVLILAGLLSGYKVLMPRYRMRKVASLAATKTEKARQLTDEGERKRILKEIMEAEEKAVNGEEKKALEKIKSLNVENRKA